ncbi:hypothetical protein [Okeania sp. SIO2B9]|uniref:Uncharacterized protein n=1 Tax=Okeania hirsuta TaxID=1458930 RepID=A0A3N6S026_9CYAN|nr:hypothetical protein [Okeania sp. SIO2B9]RQH22546.1 hypothetical protein D4Z78_07205 [Okeania hirsuta]RQH57436.1 hypothetical protein D5R40_01010 [Okeania hirsuta]
MYDINPNYLGVNPPARPSQEGKSVRPSQKGRKNKKPPVEGALLHKESLEGKNNSAWHNKPIST